MRSRSLGVRGCSIYTYAHTRTGGVAILINFMVEMQQTEPTEVEVVVMTRTVEMEWSKFSCVTGHDSGHFEWSLLPAAIRKSKKQKQQEELAELLL